MITSSSIICIIPFTILGYWRFLITCRNCLQSSSKLPSPRSAPKPAPFPRPVPSASIFWIICWGLSPAYLFCAF
jgi:hypothetical protein